MTDTQRFNIASYIHAQDALHPYSNLTAGDTMVIYYWSDGNWCTEIDSGIWLTVYGENYQSFETSSDATREEIVNLVGQRLSTH